MISLPARSSVAAVRKLAVSLSFVLLATSCSKPKTTARRETPSEPVRKIEACSLLTSEELQSVQGEALQNAIPSAPATPTFTISQCYFNLPTNTNSVVLTVTQRGGGAGAKDPREFFEETFHKSEKGEAEERGEEKEKGTPPQKVDGLGDEAFWAASPVGGALYVRKGDLFLRVSTGGTNQLERSKKLAQIALGKL